MEESEEQEDPHEEAAGCGAALGDHENSFEEEKSKASDSSETGKARKTEGDAREQSGVEESRTVDWKIADSGAGHGKDGEEGSDARDDDGAPHGDAAGLFCFVNVADIGPIPRRIVHGGTPFVQNRERERFPICRKRVREAMEREERS